MMSKEGDQTVFQICMLYLHHSLIKSYYIRSRSPFCRSFGSLNLSSVALSGVGEQMEKHVDNFTESKGVKAHFRLDDSGLLHLDDVSSNLHRIHPVHSPAALTPCYLGEV